jgi:enamine deaminase RidA (YjgF/YER057c/UK114 family)
MKPLLISLAALACLPSTAGAQVVRHPAPAPSILLDSVTVPANAETIYLSGQVAAPVDPARAGSADLADYGDTRAQTVSVLKKIETVLAARGLTMGDVVKLTVYLVADPKTGRMDFAGMNAGFRQFFLTSANPVTVARSTVQVAALVSPAYLVEIEATAARASMRK